MTNWAEGTWEDAAHRAIIHHDIDRPANIVTPYRELYDKGHILFLATKAFTEFNSRNEPWSADDMVELLASKQHAYGHENIDRFGTHGILVRLWDKISRYENLTARGVTVQEETVDDTLIDIVGYVVLYQMLLSGEFAFPLEADRDI
jgi:hypothetical protein